MEFRTLPVDEDTGGNATRKRGRERVNPATGNEATLSRNGWQIFGRHDGRRFQKNANPTNVEVCDSTTIYNTDSAVILSNHIQKWAHTNR